MQDQRMAADGPLRPQSAMGESTQEAWLPRGVFASAAVVKVGGDLAAWEHLSHPDLVPRWAG